jgi:hypothetical protein
MVPGSNTADDIVHGIGEGVGILDMEDVRLQSYNTVPGLRLWRDELPSGYAHKLLDLEHSQLSDVLNALILTLLWHPVSFEN